MSAEFDAVPARPLAPWQAGIGVVRFHSTRSSHGFEVLGQFSALTIAGGSISNQLLCACYSVTALSMACFRINDPYLDIADQLLISEREQLNLSTTSALPAIPRYHALDATENLAAV
ncbi:hypothetical protein GGI14_004209 [Coemansia sp. S680]|nr:hypothetical protein GGI14_004209 [Coemansia sp. S680]